MKPVFYQGKKKAFTLSFDDATTQDYRLVELFNKYNVKCTFNLNSGRFGVKEDTKGFPYPSTHNKIEACEVKDLYAGHEVAVHTVTHPFLQYLDEATIYEEVMEDRVALEELVGYPVCGMAYPYGTYNDLVVDILADCGIKYSRTVETTKAFGYPQDFLKWHPTCHFGDDIMDEMTDKFISIGHDGGVMRHLPIYYVWGHSFELDGNGTWEKMEELLKKVSGIHDVWYATNMELVEYYEALQNLVVSADGTMVKNNSAISVWMEDDGNVIEIKPGETKMSIN